MHTCVVAIHGLHESNNFQHLPLQFERKGVRFVIHTNPQIETDTFGPVANYDLLLDVGVNTVYSQADLISNRLNKQQQSHQLRQWAKAVEAKHFIPVPVYSKNTDPTNVFDFNDMSDRVVIKPTDGARGMGHIVFDTRIGNIFKFMASLNSAGDASRVKSILKDNAHAMEFHQGQVHHDNESFDVLHSQRLYVTGLVEGITHEVRLVTDFHGNPNLIKLRERVNTRDNFQQGDALETGYLQATGANRDDSTRLNALNDLPVDAVFITEITQYLKLMPAGNSVDLFFTENGWGVFEYCNQFGTEAYTIEESREFHKQLIEDMYHAKYGIVQQDLYQVMVVNT